MSTRTKASTSLAATAILAAAAAGVVIGFLFDNWMILPILVMVAIVFAGLPQVTARDEARTVEPEAPTAPTTD